MYVNLVFVDLNVYAKVAWTSVYCKDQFCSKIHLRLVFLRSFLLQDFHSVVYLNNLVTT
jgi:hypothetical protein